MKIVIIGGSGLIGKKLGALLSTAGHEVVSASPSTGVDAFTGKGLSEALAGANVVVDVTNPKSFAEDEAMSFFTTSAKNLIAAERAAGVGHHIAVSVVGADVMDSGYMRAKVAMEKLIADSGIPYTIFRATQFYEFLKSIGDFSLVDGVPHLPPSLMQPLAADDVALELSRVATAAPVNGIVELAGPEQQTIAEFVQRAFTLAADTRKVVTDPSSTYFGAKVDDRSLNPSLPNPRIAPTTFAQWAARS